MRTPFFECEDCFLEVHAPLYGFILLLAKGRKLPLIFDPGEGIHGDYSIDETTTIGKVK
ncbi:hypothetical protein UFOVP1299_25 [uncultured Caudovirales phage]|uniref:Uncharacterized protein n=1 Tax=uncultured Caudovirales phage TaxID=2100421 RepID=A0A6J5RHT6_9CAUD|nr:hypothetical protein UFOVP1299_25 [uncultured Caudovirales phage]